ncbi:transmembrane protein 139 [Zonotrichia albicollis]|uniref:transmembrane protein 139 n=1 Tax=Zonotrichia albicollis TaxID=44394 RepID=UPI0003942B8B|nr:transmembrane protein 139 [Zonotrichia albicollis]XP_026653772.1 transmembrane protein 139 [Zonotrichia albicollis]
MPICSQVPATTIPSAMLLETRWKNIRQTLLLLFTAALLIGVTMLAISSNINPVGYFFLGVGGVCLVGYLLSVFVECYLRNQHRRDANEIPPNRQSQAGVNAAYEAPTYEEVMTMSAPAPAIWTITSNPGSVPSPLSEPPPYNVVIESSAQQGMMVEALRGPVPADTVHPSDTDTGSRTQLQLVLPPRLQRFVSDIHEDKDLEERFEPLEPLTPPPPYETAISDEVFADAHQPSVLGLTSPSMNTEPNPHSNTGCS